MRERGIGPSLKRAGLVEKWRVSKQYAADGVGDKVVTARTCNDVEVVGLEAANPVANLIVVQFFVTLEQPNQCGVVDKDSGRAARQVDVKGDTDGEVEPVRFYLMGTPTSLCLVEAVAASGDETLVTVVIFLV